MQAKPLIRIDAGLIRLCETSTVVTANERQRAALITALAQHRRGLGGAQPDPRVDTLTGHLRSRFESLRLRGVTDLSLLGDSTQRLIWLERAPQISEFDADNLYPAAEAAWRLIHDWQLLPALKQFGDNENHRLFRRWAETYLRDAKAHRWLTEPELPAFISRAIENRELPAQSLLLFGFDVVSPSLKRFIEAHKNAGATINVFAGEHQRAAEVQAVAVNHAEQEIRAAIHWARNIVAHANEPVAVAIAVPSLVQSHDRIVRELDAILRPDDFDAQPGTSPYNISGGVPLGSVAVINDGLKFLEWLSAPLHYSEAARLLRSPFLRLDIAASNAQNPQLPETYDAATFAAYGERSPLQAIIDRARLTGLVELDKAVTLLLELLETAGWPNVGRLASESFQAYQAFISLLEELATDARSLRPRDFGATIRQIHRVADRRMFAPQRPEAPLQVLGYLETTGLAFTHLWVTGVNHLDWPASPSPSPFIPASVLRAAHVARCDSESEIAFARRMTEHWHGAAAAVVFSYAKSRADASCRLSPLVSEIAHSVQTAAEGADHPGHPFLVQRPHRRAEPHLESPVGPVDPDHLRHRGSGLLRDQSACPFRAFARYRLHLIEPRLPHSYPDAAERGIAIHAALREVSEKLGLGAGSEPTDEASIAHVLDAAASTALAAYRRLPLALQRSERGRLTALLRDWLQIEMARPTYRVFATEYDATLLLAGILFQLRIDRIDRIGPADQLLVIDYKTAAISANAVIGDRPEEPQLALYALSLPQSVAIAFGQIRSGDCRLTGWSDESTTMRTTEVRLNAPPAEFRGKWSALREHWSDRLEALAAEFRNGVADVTPRNASTCRECNLHTLCRIDEVRTDDQ
jgi:ATP-dependent helicase/nuclease subunit B